MGVNENEDEYFYVDDNRLSNFVDIADAEELDHIDGVNDEDIPVLSEDFIAKCYSTCGERMGTTLAGVRGYGISHRTYKMRKKKLRERASSVLTCSDIADFLVSNLICNKCPKSHSLALLRNKN